MSVIQNVTELRLGRKVAIVLHKPGGVVEVLVDCDQTDDAYIKIEMTAETYAAYAMRTKTLQTIAPAMPKEVRETLISGTTPAEWRAMFEPGLPDYTVEELKAFGYVLPGDESHG